MQPIKEFKFGRLDVDLAMKYIKFHNEVMIDLIELRNGTTNKEIVNYLDIIFSFFKSSLVNPSEVKESVICATLGDIKKITSLLEDDALLNLPIAIIELQDLASFNKITSYGKKNKISIDPKAPSVLFKYVLLAIFRYDARRKHLLQFYKKNKYQVCLYCLAQNTSSYTASEKKNKVFLTGNLDHIHSKDKYPFLAISLNNLVPVCAHCNQRKSKTVFSYNPFNSKHKHKFDFSGCWKIKENNSEVVLTSLKNLDILPVNEGSSDLAAKLDFKDLYKNFNENADILVERFKKFNSDGYKDSLSKIIDDSNPESTIKYFISEIPLEEGNILKHPLTKFKIDLYAALKMKYDGL